MKFEIGKTYKIDCEEAFVSDSSTNRKIFDMIGSEPWKVMMVDGRDNDVVIIKMKDGKVIKPEEIDNELGVFFTKHDEGIIEITEAEIEPESTCHAYAIIDIKGVVHYCTEDQVESRVKDLLTEMPDSSVKVFKFDAEYQASLKIEKI